MRDADPMEGHRGRDWRRVPLADVCSIMSGGTPAKSDPTYWRGDIPWVSGKDMKAPVLYDTIDHVSHEALTAGSRLAPAGAVFLLVRGMGLAKDLPVAVARREMAFNQDIKALVPKDARLGPYIRAAIYHDRERLLSRIVPSAHGTMTLNLHDVASFEILMPASVEEALTIGQILLLVHSKQELAIKEEMAAAVLKDSAMRDVFRRGLRGEAQIETRIGPLPKNWEIAPLGAIARIGNGTTPNRTNPAYWMGGTIPWITSGRMYERRISGAEMCVTPVAVRENSLPLLQPGVILIAIVGQGRTLGHCAILDAEATVSRHVGFVQPNDDAIVPEFLVGYLESQYQQLRQLASGNGSTRGALTCAILRQLQVPLPGVEEQREIAALLDAIERKMDVHRRKRAVLDGLFKALLHKLLTGEIRVADLDLSALGSKSTEDAA
jgi:type I restriction enzyme, S subunit